MPAIEEIDFLQRAVLMRDTGTRDAYGRVIVGDAEDIWVRWEWGQRQQLGAQGQPIAIDATVFAAEELPVGSRMWLAPDPRYSAVEQFLGTGSGGDDDDVMEIISGRIVPDIKNRFVRYQHALAWWKDNPEPRG